MNNQNKIVIFDIDGTLSNCEHRQHFLEAEPKDWENFFKSAEHDEPIEPMHGLLTMLKATGNIDIVLCTGRAERMRSTTLKWLEDHEVVFDALHMRPDSDRRSDALVKKEMIQIIGRERIWFVVDDRTQVVQMWRKEGLLCLQCADGNF